MKPKQPVYLLFILIFMVLGVQKTLAGEHLTVVAVGDIMMGSTSLRGILPPNDGQDLFKNISPFLNGGDIIFGNLEGPLLDEGESFKCRPERSRFCFEFKTPTRYGLYLKQAGFNVLNLANNHTLDFGEEGLNSTLSTLDSLGINPSGGKAVASMDIKGKKVALAGFSYTASPVSFSILDPGKAKEIVGKLKETHDLVVVSFHGGAEGKSALQVSDETEIFLNENRGNVRLFSRSVIDAGADLVLGHGPHVLRALEFYKGKLIAYSLGNFLTYGMFNLKGPNGISVILKITLDMENGAFLEGRVIPVKLVDGGIPEWDPALEGMELLRKLTRNGGPNFTIQISDAGEISLIR
ncbi:MAG: CapA family protein [Pseudomonadota bacterium]